MRPGGGPPLGGDRERSRSSHLSASCAKELRWERAGVDRERLEFGHEGQGFVVTGLEGGRREETGSVVDAAAPPMGGHHGPRSVQARRAPPFVTTVQCSRI